jgi:saposin
MECDDIIDTYGTEILKYADSILDPKFVCEKLGVCPAKKEQLLLGDNKCTFGPSYWCASRENADECNAMEHCLKIGKLN